MKIDPKLVEQFRDAAWDAHPMPDDTDKRLQYIAKRAADHALEEAAKELNAEADTTALSTLARHYRETAKFLRAMKGEQ